MIFLFKKSNFHNNKTVILSSKTFPSPDSNKSSRRLHIINKLSTGQPNTLQSLEWVQNRNVSDCVRFRACTGRWSFVLFRASNEPKSCRGQLLVTEHTNTLVPLQLSYRTPLINRFTHCLLRPRRSSVLFVRLHRFRFPVPGSRFEDLIRPWSFIYLEPLPVFEYFRSE